MNNVRAGVERDISSAPQGVQIPTCEQRAILISLHNLMTFPWVHERVENNTPTLHARYFYLVQVKLLRYNTGSNIFEKL